MWSCSLNWLTEVSGLFLISVMPFSVSIRSSSMVFLAVRKSESVNKNTRNQVLSWSVQVSRVNHFIVFTDLINIIGWAFIIRWVFIELLLQGSFGLHWWYLWNRLLIWDWFKSWFIFENLIIRAKNLLYFFGHSFQIHF